MKDELLIAALRPGVYEEAQDEAARETLPPGVVPSKYKGKQDLFRVYYDGKDHGFFKVIDGVRGYEKAKLLAIALRIDGRKASEIVTDEEVAAEKDRRLIAHFGPEIWGRALARAVQPGTPRGVDPKNNDQKFDVRTDKSAPIQTFSAVHGRESLMAKALAIGTVFKAREDQNTAASIRSGNPQSPLNALSPSAPPPLPPGQQPLYAGDSTRNPQHSAFRHAPPTGPSQATPEEIQASETPAGNSAHAPAGTAGSSRGNLRPRPKNAAADVPLKDELLIAALHPGVYEQAQAQADDPILPPDVIPGKYKGQDQFLVRHDGKVYGTFKVIDGVRDYDKAKLLAIAVHIDGRKAGEIVTDEEVTAEKDRRLIARLDPEIWERAQARAAEPGTPGGVISLKGGQTFQVPRAGSVPCQTFGPINGREPLMAKALAIGIRFQAQKDES